VFAAIAGGAKIGFAWLNRGPLPDEKPA